MSTVFVDVDTQLDFLASAGALYVPGAELIEPTLGKLTQFALARNIQIVSTADAHTEDDPEFRTWKPHCVIGTQGQQRCSSTSTGKAVVLSNESGTLAPQIIVEKHSLDPFTNPHLRVLLGRLGAERYVVYGLVTEYCVAEMIFGLLGMGAKVELVIDAIKALTPDGERRTLERFRAGGGNLVMSAEILER